MNITVYLGASDGNDKTFKRAIKELGTWIGISGNTLVYGGSKTGLMGKLADSVLNVFVTFPGGTGTLEEVSEVMCKISMKQLNNPCILYNLDGYYSSLKELLNHMIEKEFSSKQRQEGIFFADNLEDIKQIVNNI